MRKFSFLLFFLSISTLAAMAQTVNSKTVKQAPVQIALYANSSNDAK